MNSTNSQNIIDVAAAVLQRPDDSFLLAQRPSGKIWAGYWEFPGGKVEAGETPRIALARELREELGIVVVTAYPWLTRLFSYPHATVRLHFFRVVDWSGELHSCEGQAFSWQRVANIFQIPLNPPQPPFFKGGSQSDLLHDESNLNRNCQNRTSPIDVINHTLSVFPILPANGPILRSLYLPVSYGISNVLELGEPEFMQRLEVALRAGLRLVQLREKNLSREALRLLALKVVALAHKHSAMVLINGDFMLAQEVNADGVQFTGEQLAELGERPALSLCGASCHNEEQLRRAEKLGCDFALLSPVLPTRSHPGEPHLGWENFAATAAGSSIPVFALGGLSASDMETAWQHGAHGIALLRQAWPERSPD